MCGGGCRFPIQEEVLYAKIPPEDISLEQKIQGTGRGKGESKSSSLAGPVFSNYLNNGRSHFKLHKKNN